MNTDPYGCADCGIQKGHHGSRFTKTAGQHYWARPTDRQILARMLARRARRRMAAEVRQMERTLLDAKGPSLTTDYLRRAGDEYAGGIRNGCPWMWHSHGCDLKRGHDGDHRCLNQTCDEHTDGQCPDCWPYEFTTCSSEPQGSKILFL